MAPWIKVLILIVVFSCPGIAFSQIPGVTDTRKIQAQADDLEDRAAEDIDDGKMDDAASLMLQAISLDPTPMRYMNYGSILYGNGVSVFKDRDQEKGRQMLRQAEIPLKQAIKLFNPNTDQVNLSQCYFMLGEMYANAFDNKQKAQAYYQQSAHLSDYSGAKEALSKLSP